MQSMIPTLSPAAQAVLNAFFSSTPTPGRHELAAALRAAADQVAPLYICGTNATRAQTRPGMRHKLLSIAAELDGGAR